MAQIIDAPRSNLDGTVRIFDQFYNFDVVVPADQYDIIFSYFLEVTKNRNIAKNFSTIIFRIAGLIQENPLKLLDYVTGTTTLETTALMIYYLNSVKSKTTLYGISVQPQPNQIIQRNIVE